MAAWHSIQSKKCDLHSRDIKWHPRPVDEEIQQMSMNERLGWAGLASLEDGKSRPMSFQS